MQIIESGHFEQKWVGRCSKCGTRAIADQSEMGEIHRDQGGSFSWVQCPRCVNSISFSPERVYFTAPKEEPRKANYILMRTGDGPIGTILATCWAESDEEASKILESHCYLSAVTIKVDQIKNL